MDILTTYPSGKCFVHQENIRHYVKEKIREEVTSIIINVQWNVLPPVMFLDRPGFVNMRSINPRQGIRLVFSEDPILYPFLRQINDSLLNFDWLVQSYYKRILGMFFTPIYKGITDGMQKIMSNAEKQKIDSIGRLRINYSWGGYRKKKGREVGGDVIYNNSNMELVHEYINSLPPDLGSLWVYAVDDTTRYAHQQHKDGTTRQKTANKVLDLVEKLQGITYEQQYVERHKNKLLI